MTPVKKRKAIVIMVDGVQVDALIAADTPTLDMMMENGIYSLSAKTQWEAST